MRLLHGALVIFGRLTDLAISVFLELSIITIFPTSTLLVGEGSKDGS